MQFAQPLGSWGKLQIVREMPQGQQPAAPQFTTQPVVSPPPQYVQPQTTQPTTATPINMPQTQLATQSLPSPIGAFGQNYYRQLASSPASNFFQQLY